MIFEQCGPLLYSLGGTSGTQRHRTKWRAPSSSHYLEGRSCWFRYGFQLTRIYINILLRFSVLLTTCGCNFYTFHSICEIETHSVNAKGCPSLCRILPLRFALDDQCGCCHSTSLSPAMQQNARKRTGHSLHIDRLQDCLFACACRSICGIQMVQMS